MVGILDDQEFLDGTERTKNSDSRELAKAFRDAGVFSTETQYGFIFRRDRVTYSKRRDWRDTSLQIPRDFPLDYSANSAVDR